MTQHQGQAVADTASRDAMDSAFDLIREAINAAQALGHAQARFIYDVRAGVPGIVELRDQMREADTSATTLQVAMWQALYTALSDVAGR